jgi:hypothetical protein
MLRGGKLAEVKKAPSTKAHPVPQDCPYCRRAVEIVTKETAARVECIGLRCVRGPWRSDVPDAVVQWNRIKLRDYGASDYRKAGT